MTRFFLNRKDGFELVVAGSAAAAYPPHTHVSTVTFLMIRKGSVTLVTPTAELSLRKRRKAVILSHTLHALYSTKFFETLALCVNRSFFSPRLRPDRAAALSHFLDTAVGEALITQTEKDSLLKFVRETKIRDTDADDSLARLRRELEAHPEDEKSLTDMAEQVHIGKGHLIRSFKKRYGLAPVGFLRQNRLRKARRALVEASSLTTAAVAAGFFDQSHFIRHFKKLYGMTPRQYLRAVQHSGGMNFANSSSPVSPARTECLTRGLNREIVPGT